MKKEQPMTIREPEVRSLGTLRNRGNQEEEQVGSVYGMTWKLDHISPGTRAWKPGGLFLYLLGMVGLRSLLWACCPRF